MALMKLQVAQPKEYKCVIDGQKDIMEVGNDNCLFSPILQVRILKNPEIDGVRYKMKNGITATIDITDEDRDKFRKNLKDKKVSWDE